MCHHRITRANYPGAAGTGEPDTMGAGGERYPQGANSGSYGRLNPSQSLKLMAHTITDCFFSPTADSQKYHLNGTLITPLGTQLFSLAVPAHYMTKLLVLVLS
jgi:hypothetical protein